MPTNRRRPLARREIHELTDRVRLMLLSGHDYSPGEQPIPTLDDLRALWELHRDDLLAERIQTRPGTRPIGWWVWECPEEPRLLVRPGVFESDSVYLRRLGLLTAAEEAAITAMGSQFHEYCPSTAAPNGGHRFDDFVS